MKFGLFKEYGALNSRPVFSAFEKSLLAAGHKVSHQDMGADVAVIWSVLWHGRMAGNKSVWDTYRKTGRPVVVLEVGGIRRNHTWKVNVNGINRAALYQPQGNGPERARQLGLSLKPWRTKGEHILLCGQHERSLQWEGMPRMSKWFLQTYEDIRAFTDRPIIFRPHPRSPLEHIERGLVNVYRQTPVRLAGTYDDFDLTFKRAWASVSWSGNTGVHSVMEGVPAITGPHSLAHTVSETCLSQIEDPAQPNRTQWLNDLAWTEFTLDEIAEGLPLNLLTPTLAHAII